MPMAMQTVMGVFNGVGLPQQLVPQQLVPQLGTMAAVTSSLGGIAHNRKLKVRRNMRTDTQKQIQRPFKKRLTHSLSLARWRSRTRASVRTNALLEGRSRLACGQTSWRRELEGKP